MPRSRTLALAFALGMLGAARTTQAALWTQTNPGGGGAFSCAGAGPSGIIVVGSDLSGAYRSLDGGQSWDVLGVWRGLGSTHVSALAFDPADPAVIHLGTDDGMFRSDDAGASVAQVLSGGYVSAVAVADADPSIVYAMVQDRSDSERGRVYRSTDRGRTWTPVSTRLPRRTRATTLVVDPSMPSTLYLVSGRDWFAGRRARLYRSTDGGSTWTRIARRLRNVLDVAVDPRDSRILWATSVRHLPGPSWTGSVWKSVDGGASWVAQAPYTGALRLRPDAPDIVRVIDVDRQAWEPESGVWETTDGGVTWTRRGVPQNWDPGWQDLAWAFGRGHGVPKTIGVSRADPDTLFWTDGQWAYRSTDGGRTFANLFTDPVSPGWWRGRGLDNTNVLALAVSAAAPSQVYAGYFDIGCQRSLDGGDSWQSCNHPDYTGGWQGFGGNTTTIVADPARPGVVWLTQGNRVDPPDMTLLRSTAAGERSSWTFANTGMPRGYVTGLSLDPSSPVAQRTLFVTSGGDVYRSSDDGTSWNRVFACGGCRVTAVDTFDGDLVFAGGESGLFRSTAGGQAGTWARVGPPEFAATGRSPLYWEEGWQGVSAIHPDPARPGWVWVAVYGPGRGVYRSTDGGVGWLQLRSDDYQRAVAVDPQNPQRVYATASSVFTSGGSPTSSGVTRSVDGGATWAPANEGLAWPFAIPLVVDPGDSSLVWVGAPGTGFHRRRF